MTRLIAVVMCAVLVGCASNPKAADLNCDARYGACQASLEQVEAGYDWWIVVADSECGIVKMESGESLPFCGHKRRLIPAGELGIASCQACVRR